MSQQTERKDERCQHGRFIGACNKYPCVAVKDGEAGGRICSTVVSGTLEPHPFGPQCVEHKPAPQPVAEFEKQDTAPQDK